LTALKRTGRGALTVGGGVASNSLLRKRLTEACEAASVDLYIPSPIFCTDNAAMIACAAHYEYLAGRTSGLDLDARANLAL
jgi:N6-L-threonylcarbamoyladenine synthase